ncbi:hypothetical protein L0657_25960 [Dyadobacter sp. CY345]|uniref:hypothetical protein n=1 Tax=Dyadobacter sp. CY345 TaxID=2909335 RepID=UPI001F461A6B|nr:hypothetical protein [Dyadobacter sp. CY345]MCF2447426.1 hypothetical protein [Dyadobacter sp. CY345]
MLSVVTYLHNRSDVTPPVSKRNPNGYRFYAGVTKINEYLFHLGNECRRGQFEVAQNTFLDMQQDWQRLDVLVKSIPDTSFQKNYWPSDSLHNLEKYLNELYLTNDREQQPMTIIKEIKRINSKIDRMRK